MRFGFIKFIFVSLDFIKFILRCGFFCFVSDFLTFVSETENYSADNTEVKIRLKCQSMASVVMT